MPHPLAGTAQAGVPCDCDRVPVGFELDCKVINDVWKMLGGQEELPIEEPPPGIVSLQPSQAAPVVFPQPFKLEIVQACELEDPDLRPYFWDCP